eukprot:CAMPEP_0182523752 /NCGR_PEP_ID=MMETSP1323-20130603/1288_1 /TAXON_ID=236787 /ORGANISM="Florenciella parvula, Strain RCC1693" /LENGTH=56 /DNA_ID=CAMNT_0024732183 /DNA_START=74 /DNA_END=244 /DNA_ORIENTATION=-
MMGRAWPRQAGPMWCRRRCTPPHSRMSPSSELMAVAPPLCAEGEAEEEGWAEIKSF